MRAAAAAGLHELAAYHALLRLRDLQQQLLQLLPAPAPALAGERQPSADLAAASSGEAATPAAETPLAGTARRISSGAGGTADAVNPAAALLAATRGSPDTALRRQQPGSPAAAAHGRQLSQQQAQQAAAKVAEAAAAAAAALCALSDAEGVAGLQAYCRQAFQMLLQQVQPKQGAEGGSDQAAALAAAAAAWDWLAAVREHAAGRFEAAVGRYSQLHAPGGALQCAPTPVLARLAAEAYAAVGDASGLLDWLQVCVLHGGDKLCHAGRVMRCGMPSTECPTDERALRALPTSQTKAGSKLPPAAAQRCLRLASWEPLEQPPAGARSSGDALQHLQLCCVDVAACGSGGSCSLAAATGQLASLAAPESGRSLTPELLLRALLTDGGQQQQCLTFWQPTDSAASAPGPLAGGHSLQPLLQLLASAALSGEQRGPLLLAAARTAAAGGNGGAALRLLASAEAELSCVGSHSSIHAEQLLWLGQLQAAASARSGGSRDTASSSLQLLLAARGRGGIAAAAVVPAAAKLLVAAEPSQLSMTAAETAGLMQACELPGLSSDSRRSITQLEQQVLALHQRPRGSGPAPSMQYAVLKVAVAADPAAAQQWWQWAAWLHSLAQQREQSAMAAAGVAFTASCRALALAGSSDSYAALPALLALLQLLLEQSSGSLPADAAAQLTAVPAAAWLPLLPQLLAHLAAADGHGAAPQAATQQLLLSLLLHVGQAAPCEVLLPAVAAAASNPAAPASPLQQLLQELRQAHPLLAEQLQTLAAEAARLAVLPEEHWHAVLQEAAATAAKRLQAHRRQAAQAADGAGEQQPASAAVAAQASGDTYLAAMAPVLLPLQQQLQAAAAAQPQTPHELRFHQQSLPTLRQLLQQLLEPLAADRTIRPASASGDAASKAQAQRAVSLLRAAAAELAASVRRKQLSLPEVAPGLAALADTRITIPGARAAGAPEQPVTLAGVCAEVAVLSTKTRPKRLRFLGSDGRHHAFLLKVREGRSA